MAWRCTGSSNAELVRNLARARIITKPAVEQAMLAVDRANYCSHQPYTDAPFSIQYGATISAPHMHAFALEALCDVIHEGSRVLDVGCGSGYLTACFAALAGETGKVVGIEHIPQLVQLSQHNIAKDHPELLENGRVDIVQGDGRNGYAAEAPYEAIHVGAAAYPVPQALLDQLKVGGRMMVPVGPCRGDQAVFIYTKNERGEITKQRWMDVRYVPLTDASKQLEGQ
ncbi:protein-L-isoaspartate O-methyltransferase-like protein [Polychytrium aggregatum]|uniref:protein-L-isoaspartate O-methyltransferase-like protein n=1 Tax=Polychytrium aggregatum TaxID=110093 RepID=UPI0022FE84BE|nr:protein-L-isoaspartate O-methyltransferase-like protein [Polychytrium aggregatum]KAI9203293.1 protein-L-isoaspartate O-methyltransferase-like protein [Polychytrium aggregatum]